VAIASGSRGIAGIAFLLGGASTALGTVLGLVGVPGGLWFLLLAYLPIAVGFGALAVGAGSHLAARIALLIAAAGYVLLLLATVLWVAGLGTAGVLAAALGGLAGSILLLSGKAVTGNAAIAFVVTTIVFAAMTLPGVVGLGLGMFVTILSLVFGLGLVVTGVLLMRVPRAS